MHFCPLKNVLLQDFLFCFLLFVLKLKELAVAFSNLEKFKDLITHTSVSLEWTFKKMSTDKTVDNAVFCWFLWGTHLYEPYRYVPPQWGGFLLLFNSWGCASIPWDIAGTRICKLVTRSLVVDGHWVESSANSRVRRSIVSKEAHACWSLVW